MNDRSSTSPSVAAFRNEADPLPWLWVRAVSLLAEAEQLPPGKPRKAVMRRKQKVWVAVAALALFMDAETGFARVSVRQLTDSTGFSRDFLRDGIRLASEQGFLHVESFPNEKRVSIYHPRLPGQLGLPGYVRSGDGWRRDAEPEPERPDSRAELERSWHRAFGAAEREPEQQGTEDAEFRRLR